MDPDLFDPLDEPEDLHPDLDGDPLSPHVIESDGHDPLGPGDGSAGYEVAVEAGPEQFDRPPGDGDVIGDPWTATPVWEQQMRPDSCAVVAQGFVIELVTGESYDEEHLVAIAEENGWYVDGGGTPPYAVGEVLNHFGIETEMAFDATMADVEAALADGQYVIAGVNASTIWQTGPLSWLDVFSFTRGADHAVQVIGIDQTDPGAPQVILNDPGHDQGQGLLVPLDLFIEAWEGTGGFMVTAAA